MIANHSLSPAGFPHVIGDYPQVVLSSKPGAHAVRLSPSTGSGQAHDEARQPGGVGAVSAGENNFALELWVISSTSGLNKRGIGICLISEIVIKYATICLFPQDLNQSD